MKVFVLNKNNKPLMPCSNCKARKLLKSNKAKVVSHKPFTIQLNYGSSNYVQPVSIGFDTGAKYIGIAIQSQNKVVCKGEIELRDDISKNIETKKIYRRSRRNRKTRYRKARFLNRVSTKKQGWLPPTIQSRIDNTSFWMDKFISLVPSPQINIEVGKFDIQKIINPSISGTEYQEGETCGYFSVRYYVFARDHYTCQVCKKKGKILQTHHITYKSHGGSDKPSNLITVCSDCHTSENHKEGQILHTWMLKNKKAPRYKEMPFMNTLRRKIFSKYLGANIVYGSETTPKRKDLLLEKTHYNDALVVSGIEKGFKNTDNLFKLKQFRKKKRSLHEATARKGRKEKNTASKRNSKNTKSSQGYFLNDCVSVFGEEGYISGFCSGGAYIKDINGQYITVPGKSYKQVGFKELKFINHNNNWQFIPHLKEDGGLLAKVY